MKPQQLDSKDLKFKYTDLMFLNQKKKDFEELKISADVSKEEMMAARNALTAEKKINKELAAQMMVFREKCEELEKNSKNLTDIIANKDHLISKL